MKIYVACSLTHVPRSHFEEYVQSIHHLADVLSQENANEVNYALVNSDPQLATKPFEDRARLCYLWDARMVQESEVVIAECSFPSIGLGVELQLAVEREIPIIIIFRDFKDNKATPTQYSNPDQSIHELQIGDGFVSLMALGLPTIFKVHSYQSDVDAASQVVSSLKLLQR